MPGFKAKPSRAFLDRGNPITEALVAAYPFDEKGGTSLRDAAGRFWATGTFAGASPPSPVTREFGRALSFNGASSRIDLPGASFWPSFGAGAGGSLAVLVRTTTTSDQRAIVFERSGGGSTAFGLNIGFSGPGLPGLFTRDSAGALVSTVGSTSVADGNWHLLVGTAGPFGTVFYLDGRSVASTPTAAHANTFAWSGTAVTLGGIFGGGGSHLNGHIAGVWVWNRQIRLTEVRQFAVDPFAMFRRRYVPVPLSVASAPVTKSYPIFPSALRFWRR